MKDDRWMEFREKGRKKGNTGKKHRQTSKTE